MMGDDLFTPDDSPEETVGVEAKPRKKVITTVIIVFGLCLGCIAGTVAGWYLGDYVIEWISSLF